MIAVIRIRGQVKLKKVIAETFNRLKLRKKLTCTFIDEKDKVKLGMLKRLKEYSAYGKVDEKLEKKVIEQRGQKDKDKKYRGFCRLHPPRGGFKKSTKKSVSSGKGILGEHKDISKLLERML